MSVYQSEGDRGRVGGLASAFTDDGVLEFSGRAHQGRDAIIAALSAGTARQRDDAAAGQQVLVRHNLTSCRIELTGPGTADAWTYFNVVTPIGFDHCGVYVDRFRKVGERWLIAHRRVKVDWRHPESRMARDGG